MKAPTEASVPPTLGVGQSVEVEIPALFDSTVLDRNEGSSASAELSVEYSSGGKTFKGA